MSCVGRGASRAAAAPLVRVAVVALLRMAVEPARRAPLALAIVRLGGEHDGLHAARRQRGNRQHRHRRAHVEHRLHRRQGNWRTLVDARGRQLREDGQRASLFLPAAAPRNAWARLLGPLLAMAAAYAACAGAATATGTGLLALLFDGLLARRRPRGALLWTRQVLWGRLVLAHGVVRYVLLPGTGHAHHPRHLNILPHDRGGAPHSLLVILLSLFGVSIEKTTVYILPFGRETLREGHEAQR